MTDPFSSVFHRGGDSYGVSDLSPKSAIEIYALCQVCFLWPDVLAITHWQPLLIYSLFITLEHSFRISLFFLFYRFAVGTPSARR